MSDFAAIRFLPNRPLLRELSADRLNTILTEIKRNKPKGERGITVRQDGTGTYIGLAASLPRGGGGFAATNGQPWDLLARVDPEADPEDENPPYKIRVRPGTLNGVLPSNWDEEFNAAGTGLHYAKAIIATDGQGITGVTIAIGTTEPAEQEPQLFAIEESVEILFGLFAEGQVYRVIGPGDIRLRSVPWLVASPDTPREFGELPYDIYYQLV
jgi:hypothetical protein